MPTAPGAFTGGAFDPDLSAWSTWWELNKAPYLDLRTRVHAPEPTTGTGGWYLGVQEAAQSSLAPTDKQVREQVVPALLAALAREDDHDVVSGALIALAKIGHDGSAADARRFEQAFTPFLADASQEIRETAAVSLGILASPRSIPALANLLWDTEAGRAQMGKKEVDYRTRSFAAYGLGLVGARTTSEAERQVIVAALARALERDATPTSDLGVACLLALSIVPLATFAPADADAAAGPRAAPESSRQAQLAYLLALLRERERDALVQAQCPVALARLLVALPPEQREPLRALVAGELLTLLERQRARPELLQSCLLALGEIGTQDGESALDRRIRAALEQTFVQASENQTRGFALVALARVGGRRGDGPSQDGREQAAEFLIRQTIDGKSMLRPWAGLACGILGHELLDSGAGAPTLARLRSGVRSVLEDERDPARLGAYAIAAGLLRDGGSTPILLARLARSLPDDARGYVAMGLALLGAREACEPARRILSESLHRPLLLRECAVALGVLGDKQTTSLLVDLLGKAHGMATQTALATALGYSGDRRTIEPLLAALVDETRSARARGYAAVALGNVADKERLPWNAKIALGLNYRAATASLTDPVRGGGILDIF